jgi:hypothetical protein
VARFNPSWSVRRQANPPFYYFPQKVTDFEPFNTQQNDLEKAP